MNILLHPIVIPITLPLAGGIVCLLLPKALDKIRGTLSVIVMILNLLLCYRLFAGGEQALANSWLNLSVDALSGFVLLASNLFGLLIAIYSLEYMSGKPRLSEYFAYLLWTMAATCGALVANDFVLLMIFWGFLGLTLYLMIGIRGPEAAAAAKKSFIIIGGSDCILMLGVAMVWRMTGTLRMDVTGIVFAGPSVYVAFLCFAAAAFAKAGAMPFHTWVPDCGEKAPVAVTAFLPASLDKLLGIYLLARVATDMFVMDVAMSSLLMIVGAGTLFLAVMMALVQHDMKRLLSYHAVSQVGYMILGIGTGHPIGIAGGLFHMLNNAIYKSGLFMCAGAVEEKTGTTDLDRLGGLAKLMPVTFITCLIASVSISGIPPTNGFASKWLVYQGIVESGKTHGGPWVIWLAIAMVGSALTLASFVKVLHAVFLRKPSPEVQNAKIDEVGFSMKFPMIVLAAVCLLFGVFAHQLPLRYLVAPAVKGNLVEPGVWWAGMGALLLAIGFAVGLLLYRLGTVSKARECPTYIGGEILGENVEVTGIDFYRTFQEMNPFKAFYAMAEQKLFDLYDVGTGVVFYFVEMLRVAHSGILPLYLTWVIAGLMALIWLLFKGGALV